MEKQPSFNGAIEQQPSFRGAMEKQKSFRGFMEKQKSFRIVMEKQLSFIGGERRKSKESPGKRGDSQLHLAARAGNLVRVKEILQNCNSSNESIGLLSKTNQEGETPLYASADNGHAVIVGEMLKHMDLQTASITARNGYDPFHIAVRQAILLDFEMLLDQVLKELLHVFPNLAMTTDLSNSTALHTAATQGHIDIVNLLLETDSNLAKIARNNGKTVLHSAARMGHLEIVKSLLNKDPSAAFRTDLKGQTALHMAVKGHNEEIVLELLKPDPSVLTVEDNKGNTALHIATRKGRIENVRCLLSINSDGSNVNASNKAGETSLDIAEKFGTPELVSVLKEAGATNSKDEGKPANPAKQLKQTVSDIKHDVQSQLKQTRQTGARVHKIAKKLKKLHISGLNNAINSATVVAVLIATLLLRPSSLFLAIQTSVVVIEQKAKKQLVFVINKLMWLACLFISIAFISLTYVVVGSHSRWLAVYATVIGSTIMLTTIGSMCYCVILHRLEESKMRNIRRAESRSRSLLYVYGIRARDFEQRV
ncbi:ankyrin repeat-containing protein [Prunus yedoensis var. nudiflora]|uniref:Ankyrin repeat-containing protein n=1 Tax=Prunus yedoensis var. nudiflora TaxID=2094558 RepID=A0A314YC30_PRUYE|nr:ankyrin repeat-containing protein [Prunus yedoensis var. nudiflora]